MVPHMGEKEAHAKLLTEPQLKGMINLHTNIGEVRSVVLLFQFIRFIPQSEVILVVYVSVQKILLLQETCQSRFMA